MNLEIVLFQGGDKDIQTRRYIIMMTSDNQSAVTNNFSSLSPDTEMRSWSPLESLVTGGQ